MTNQREILRLSALGLSQAEIASSCNCGRNTVSRTLKRAREENLTWEKAKDLTESVVNDLLFKPRGSYQSKKMPDYEYVFREMQKSGVSLYLLWLEYCEQCRLEGSIPYQSSQFNHYYNEYVQKNKATMHLEHKPGDEMQVDWAGQTAFVIDSDTGAAIPAYIFVAVLPYSGYTYVEAFPNEKQESWIEAHVHELLSPI